MDDWEFVHSVFTTADLGRAWGYWSDMRNHAALEPAVDRIELDGPFATGTKGCSIGKEFRHEWELREVVDKQQFTITGSMPGMALSFTWAFESAGNGTRLTQRISAVGPRTQEFLGELRQMEQNAPAGMARLAEIMDRLPQLDDQGH